MLAHLNAFIHTPVVTGAITGLLAAAHADFETFKTWKSFQDALTFNWQIAVFKWLQGAAVGAATAAGYSALIN